MSNDCEELKVQKVMPVRKSSRIIIIIIIMLLVS